jgi:hypothetical protein
VKAVGVVTFLDGNGDGAPVDGGGWRRALQFGGVRRQPNRGMGGCEWLLTDDVGWRHNSA